MSRRQCRERGRSLGSLIERIERIGGSGFGGNIEGWKAEMGAG